MASLKERGIIALDKMGPEEALSRAARMAGHARGIKYEGLLFGPMPTDELIGRTRDMGFEEVFADAKEHRTPEATAEVVEWLALAGATYISVHVTDEPKLIQAAVKAYRAARSDPAGGILALTVLTTSGQLGMPRDTNVVDAARSVLAAKPYGFICSPLEVYALTKLIPNVRAFTPGIRLPGSPPGRHARYASPAQALERGAHRIIIGEGIADQADPVAAIERFNATIARLP